ncbi:epididymal protein 13 [Nannospalax galili]|uniref:epididymal protein 13 n=1 Tax=Nannospalax galili TaxID=1026970 RepID=UPI00111C4DD6|nr:epididymal protein 13 [Nannospalax galili]
MCRLELLLKRSLLVLLLLGLAEACIPHEVAMEEKNSTACASSVTLVTTAPLLVRLPSGIFGLMSRLSPDGLKQNIISSSKMPPLVPTPDRTEEEMTSSATTMTKSTRWNFLRCTYMAMTFFFMSDNKGDWCYCHYCNPELDVRDDPCCSFQ